MAAGMTTTVAQRITAAQAVGRKTMGATITVVRVPARTTATIPAQAPAMMMVTTTVVQTMMATMTITTIAAVAVTTIPATMEMMIAEATTIPATMMITVGQAMAKAMTIPATMMITVGQAMAEAMTMTIAVAAEMMMTTNYVIATPLPTCCRRENWQSSL